MTGYTKLFGSILRSTVWRTPPHVRLVWITMLALSDRDGVVDASVPGLADAAGVSISECEQALALFQAPDPYSRTPDHEGRRVEKVDGGWRLLNHHKYQQKLGLEERREKDRLRQQRHRASRDRHVTSAVSRDVTPVTPGHAESDMQMQTQMQTQTPRSTSVVPARAPVREAPAMAEARAHLDAFEARCEAVRAAVDRECRAVRRSPPPPACTAMSPEVTGIARWLATAGEVDIDAMVRRWANARDRKGSWAPLSWLAANPGEYAFPAPSDSVVRLTSEQEDQSVRDFIDAGTRRAGGVA